MADPVGGAAPPRGEDSANARVVKVRSDERRPVLLAGIVVVAILALAVLKPWGGEPSRAVGPDEAPAGPGRVATASPGRAATPAATQPGFGAPGGQCYAGAGWRVFAIETDTGRSQRAWLSIEPIQATSPQDTAVPFVRIVTDRLLALGFCVGSGPEGPGPLVGARAWALAPEGRAAQVALAPLVEYMPRPPSLGAVYRPPAGSPGAASAAWTPGRYVFAVRQGPPGGREWWFGVDVEAPPETPSKVAPAPGSSTAPAPGSSTAP